MNTIQKAELFAREKHISQLDDSGKPYFGHLEQVARIVMLLTQDEDIIAAAFLHDTIEDTDTTYEDLEKEFGKRIADLVHEVTHDGQKDEVGYYFPRLKSQDAILIKFADRASNLSRMEPWTPQRRAHYLKKSKFWKSNP